MPTATNNSTGSILILPWNRLPNHLICVVALINLIVGVLALREAFGFARSGGGFNEMLAAVSIGIFGLMLIWVAWCFRRGLLPVRFVADAEKCECGFRWACWWNGRYDLTNAQQLIGELRPRKEKWQWAILIPSNSPERKKQWIYGSSKLFESADAAETDCQKNLSQLGQHLTLPFEICKPSSA